jgi:hypothetical protein
MNHRILGTIAMICAPALLIEALIDPIDPNPLTIGIASFVFMLGWLCTNIAMQQMQAIGTGLAAKIVLRVQMVGVTLAMIFGVIEAGQLLPDDNIIFIITDLCWPLSMLFMLVVGIMAIRANRWAGWQRFMPLICGLWLPGSMLIRIIGGEGQTMELVSTFIGFGWTAVAWFVLALIVRSNATLALPKADTLPKQDTVASVS